MTPLEIVALAHKLARLQDIDHARLFIRITNEEMGALVRHAVEFECASRLSPDDEPSGLSVCGIKIGVEIK